MESPLKPKRVGRRAVLAGAAAVAALGRVRPSLGVERTSVRFAFFGDAAETKAYQRLIAAFEAIHPAIRIEVAGTTETSVALGGMIVPASPYPQWLQTSFVGSAPPDVFLLGYRDFGSYAARGVIEPLSPFVGGSSVIGEPDFYSAALDAFRSVDFPGTGLGAIPQNASSLAVYYNTDIFASLDVARPETGWTWDDFASIAKTLTRDRNDNGRIDLHGLAVEPSISRYSAFIWGAGGDLFDALDHPTNLTISSPAAQEGLAWFTNLGPSGLNVTPSESESRHLDDTTRFQQGRAAMLIQSRRATPALRDTPGLRWDVAPLPIGKQPANVLHSDGFALFSGSKVKDAAWSFIEFATGPEGQRLLAETGRTVPSLRSIAESDSFLTGGSAGRMLGIDQLTLAPANARAFLDNIAISRRLPSSTRWPGVTTIFNRAFRQAFYVDADVKAAALSATAASDGVLRSVSAVQSFVFHAQAAETEE